MSDDQKYQVTAGMDRLIGDVLDKADRNRLPDTKLCFESYDGQHRESVSAAIMEEDDEDALRDFLVEECGTNGRELADRFIDDWQAGNYRSAVLSLRDAHVDFTVQAQLDVRSWADRDDERALESGGLAGVRARLEQAMTLIEQTSDLLNSADVIALDEDPHYLAAAFTDKTVSLCDQLAQVVRYSIEQVDDQEQQSIRQTVYDLASTLGAVPNDISGVTR